MDAIDSALLRISETHSELLTTHEHAIPASIRSEIAALSHSGSEEIERMGKLDRALGSLFADATQTLLEEAGIEAADVAALGSHGQTIRHRPQSAGTTADKCFTLQIGDPNTIAERTGITTVADFRRRDIAAGGEGAPLAPAFHASAFTKPGINRAIVNIGGIANASLLAGNDLVAGFDTGPGNTLLDLWVAAHQNQRYDAGGQWAAQGTVIPPLLKVLKQHPYFELLGPRSTGKEDFHLAWLEEQLFALNTKTLKSEPCDVQATLAEFTAITIADAITAAKFEVQEVYVCGGGAHNEDLIQRLARAIPKARIATTADLGISPDWVEAATFAWLAFRTLADLPGNAPVVTGAQGYRVLGGIYPGG